MSGEARIEDVLRERLADVRGRIAAAAARAGRDPSSVTLVGVAKRKSAPLVAAAVRAGWRDIGATYSPDAREKLLVSFTGAGAEGPDWLGVVFGRGKLLNPPLTGTEITAAGIRDLLDSVTAKCTCLNQASKMGVDIPMTWGKDLDEKIVKFQVSDEAIAEAEEATRAAEAQFEELLASKTAEAAPVSTPAEAASADRPMQTTLWVLGALLVILALSTVTVLRRRQA